MELWEVDQMVKLIQRFLEAQRKIGAYPEAPGGSVAMEILRLGQPLLNYLQEIGYGK